MPPGADQNFLAPWANIEKLQSSDSGHPVNVRAEAARALGSLDLPKAYTMLLDSSELYVRPNKADGGHELAEDILVALGKRNIEETAEFFDRLLLDSTLSQEFRELSLDSLENASGHHGSFAMRYLEGPNVKM